MNNVLIPPEVSVYIGVLVQWGFLMAFLYSLTTSINNPTKQAVWLSLVMAISYCFSFFIDIYDITYIELFCYDVATLFFIFFLRYYLPEKRMSTYLLFGLSINSLLFLAMHIDVFVRGNYTPWWFWSLYTVVINMMDIIMVSIFFVKKDFLMLVHATDKLVNGVMRLKQSG
ncbi:hypothetical protein [Pseudoalteromonas carrageenovora]|uniref:hypothetical protein n=1 Tax=Pseudoalteromonas carrageenovora TaxID=227 RepID=UPI0026E2361E|nr:hypothetical protein [Pseudoalteromonas carrageenovora]MDO6547792.1 hypothetical protein [Pseudoalteromonas carrageenovora]MDO6832351.1 hypothetical protein [Pseudoalteromonas carrageenovora]